MCIVFCSDFLSVIRYVIYISKHIDLQFPYFDFSATTPAPSQCKFIFITLCYLILKLNVSNDACSVN